MESPSSAGLYIHKTGRTARVTHLSEHFDERAPRPCPAQLRLWRIVRSHVASSQMRSSRVIRIWAPIIYIGSRAFRAGPWRHALGRFPRPPPRSARVPHIRWSRFWLHIGCLMKSTSSAGLYRRKTGRTGRVTYLPALFEKRAPGPCTA